jgi:flagella basal body P-ring formation protein FlgA
MWRRVLVLGIGILVSLANLGSAAVSRGAEPFLLEIPAEVTVAGPKISLADLGWAHGALESDVDFLRGLELGLAPLPGQTRIFTRKYLEFILKQQNACRRPVLQMGLQVTVRSETTTIEGVAIAAAINRQLPEQSGIIKQWVEIANLPERICLPKGSWRIEASVLNGRVRVGSNVFKVKLIGAAVSRTLNLTGVVHQIAVVYRAKRNLAAKQPLLPENFEKLQLKLTSGREYIGDFPQGYRYLRSLRRGQVLLAEGIQPEPQVLKGSEVRVVFNEAGISVSLTARAKQDGWTGDRITLVNQTTKKEFQGQVVQAGIVAVGR